MWRLRLPALAQGAAGLTQDHAVAGERQGTAVPVFAPMPGFVKAFDRLAEALRVAETHDGELPQALRHAVRAVRPVPDEQADAGSVIVAECLPRHQPGNLAACAEPAGCGLNMICQAPIQLALEDKGVRGCQVFGDGGQAPRGVRPVLAVTAVATADGLMQAPGTIDQGHRHTVDLGLNPQILACLDPGTDRGVIRQFSQPGLRHRMGDGPGATGQRIGWWRYDFGKTTAPPFQAGAGLVVEFVGDRRGTLAVVGIVPVGDLLGEGGDFNGGPLRRPGGTSVGPGGECEREQAQRNPAFHRERPCSRYEGYRLVRFPRRTTVGQAHAMPAAGCIRVTSVIRRCSKGVIR
ncbi:hypothetical protein D9M68_521120 [compost metagenome]